MSCFSFDLVCRDGCAPSKTRYEYIPVRSTAASMRQTVLLGAQPSLSVLVIFGFNGESKIERDY